MSVRQAPVPLHGKAAQPMMWRGPGLPAGDSGASGASGWMLRSGYVWAGHSPRLAHPQPTQRAHTPHPAPARAPRSVSVDAIGLSQCETVYVHTDTGTDTRLKSEPRRGECPTQIGDTAIGVQDPPQPQALCQLRRLGPECCCSTERSRPNTISRGEPIAAAFPATSSPTPRHCCDSLACTCQQEDGRAMESAARVEGKADRSQRPPTAVHH